MNPREEAQFRHDQHIDHPTHRPLSRDYELVGVAGERELCAWAGVPYVVRDLPGGDRGIDLWLDFAGNDGEVHHLKLDVKCARIPKHLWVEVGHCDGKTIYVLAGYDEPYAAAFLLGWEWGCVLLKAETVLSKDGVLNHSIKRGLLRSIKELEQRRVRNDG